MPLSKADRESRLQAGEEDASSIGQTVDDAGLQSVASNVAKEAGLHLPPGDAFGRLVEAVQRALLEHYSREADRLRLQPEQSLDPLFSGIGKSSPPEPTALTLSRAVELFKGAPERANVASKTRAAYEFRYEMLMALLGEATPVHQITRAHLRHALNTLSGLPPNAIKRWPGVPLNQVVRLAKEAGIPPMSPKSIALYLHAANALWRWLVLEDLALKNPAVGLRGPTPPDETDRRPFTVAELNKLFAAPSFNGGGASGRTWLFWVPRVALFTGARFGELIGLNASDYQEVEGLPVLAIAPNEERRLKNKGSRRLVPVHPELIKLGFGDYATGLPKDGLLFPDAAGPKDMLNARNKEIGRKIRQVLPESSVGGGLFAWKEGPLVPTFSVPLRMNNLHSNDNQRTDPPVEPRSSGATIALGR